MCLEAARSEGPLFSMRCEYIFAKTITNKQTCTYTLTYTQTCCSHALSHTLRLATHLLDVRPRKFRFSARATLSNLSFYFLDTRFGDTLKSKILYFPPIPHPQCPSILALHHHHFRERLRERGTQPPIIVGIPRGIPITTK